MVRNHQLFPQPLFLYQQPPQDNFDRIVESSRRFYARNRADVEAEIRATIEQSEKYKKELSDSGRVAGEEGGNNIPENVSISAGNYNQKQKPAFQYSPTPQSDFKKLKLSPNAAEGKEHLSLKDLGEWAAKQNAENRATKPQPNHNPRKRTQKNHRG